MLIITRPVGRLTRLGVLAAISFMLQLVLLLFGYLSFDRFEVGLAAIILLVIFIGYLNPTGSGLQRTGSKAFEGLVRLFVGSGLALALLLAFATAQRTGLVAIARGTATYDLAILVLAVLGFGIGGYAGGLVWRRKLAGHGAGS